MVYKRRASNGGLVKQLVDWNSMGNKIAELQLLNNAWRLQENWDFASI